MHCVTVNKTDAIYMVCGRNFLTHVHNTPSRPGHFLSARPKFLERSEVFKQKFPGVGPSNIYVTRLQNRPGPLTWTMVQIERLLFRHIWSMMTRSIHDCWHVRTNKCVRINTCKTSLFVFSIWNVNFVGRILTQVITYWIYRSISCEHRTLPSDGAYIAFWRSVPALENQNL